MPTKSEIEEKASKYQLCWYYGSERQNGGSVCLPLVEVYEDEFSAEDQEKFVVPKTLHEAEEISPDVANYWLAVAHGKVNVE